MATNNDTKVKEMREKIHAVTDRRIASARTRQEATYAGIALGLRFAKFVRAIEQSNRIRVRFALHTERVAFATSEQTQAEAA